jgi:hypothetical protein
MAAWGLHQVARIKGALALAHPLREAGFRDFIIGDASEDFFRAEHGMPLSDPSDFVLGSGDLLDPGEETHYGDINVPRRRAEVDFLSIADLIEEEIGPTEEAAHAEVISSAKPKRAERVPVEPELVGEDAVLAEAAATLYRKLKPELDKLSALEVFPQSERQILLDFLHQHQAAVREHHKILQDLVSSFIRQGQFSRVAAVDAVKRTLDELLLQMRAIENRITNRGHEIVAGAYVDGTSAQELFNAAEAQPVAKTRKTKEKHRGGGFRVPERAKQAVALFIILVLWPLGYYTSKNWGVEKVKVIDVAHYRKVLPLERASGSKKAFHAVVEDRWKKTDQAAKEQALRQLAAMVKVEGYDSIFLTYPTHGIAAIYSIDREKILVQ